MFSSSLSHFCDFVFCGYLHNIQRARTEFMKKVCIWNVIEVAIWTFFPDGNGLLTNVESTVL